MASRALSFNSFTVALVAVLFFAVAAAQELSPVSAPASAPGPDAGAAGTVSSSVAMIGASIVLSMLAAFKH